RRSFGQHYDLCGPHVYTLKQLVEYTASAIGVRRRVIGLSDLLSRWQAHIFEYLPGKPFSWDNYQSLRVDSVCRGSFPFGTQPTALEAVVPGYLTHRTARSRYPIYRSHA
ncbi:MAG: complex I NDUFA9 subunit family protein, partial [Gammaproteobacteria bacterium]|nr:complex I NDUFA9 subunit family protein [Gammaproteobacteria bacterium]